MRDEDFENLDKEIELNDSDQNFVLFEDDEFVAADYVDSPFNDYLKSLNLDTRATQLYQQSCVEFVPPPPPTPPQPTQKPRALFQALFALVKFPNDRAARIFHDHMYEAITTKPPPLYLGCLLLLWPCLVWFLVLLLVFPFLSLASVVGVAVLSLSFCGAPFLATVRLCRCHTQLIELMAVWSAFDNAVQSSLSRLQMAELVFRGYRVTTPLPPISLIEKDGGDVHCRECREALVAALEECARVASVQLDDTASVHGDRLALGSLKHHFHELRRARGAALARLLPESTTRVDALLLHIRHILPLLRNHTTTLSTFLNSLPATPTTAVDTPKHTEHTDKPLSWFVECLRSLQHEQKAVDAALFLCIQEATSDSNQANASELITTLLRPQISDLRGRFDGSLHLLQAASDALERVERKLGLHDSSSVDDGSGGASAGRAIAGQQEHSAGAALGVIAFPNAADDLRSLVDGAVLHYEAAADEESDSGTEDGEASSNFKSSIQADLLAALSGTRREDSDVLGGGDDESSSGSEDGLVEQSLQRAFSGTQEKTVFEGLAMPGVSGSPLFDELRSVLTRRPRREQQVRQLE